MNYFIKILNSKISLFIIDALRKKDYSVKKNNVDLKKKEKLNTTPKILILILSNRLLMIEIKISIIIEKIQNFTC